MLDQNNWITIEQAKELTGKSEITIRRFVSKHKLNTNVISKNNTGKTIIDPDILQENYIFTKETPYQYDSADSFHDKNDRDTGNKKNNQHTSHDRSQTYHNDRHDRAGEQGKDLPLETEKLALMTISKQSNDISQMLLHRPFYRHSTFWTVIAAIIIIIVIIAAGWLYRKELVKTYINMIQQVTMDNKNKQDEQKQNFELQKNSLQYQIKLINSSNTAMVDTLNQRIDDLKDNLKENKKKLSEEIINLKKQIKDLKTDTDRGGLF
jgi:hypothetical protein